MSFPDKPMLQKGRERIEYAKKWANPGKGVGIEIGPFDKPLIRRQFFPNVKYLDYFSREHLVEIAKNHPNKNPDLIPEIDYVLDGKKISEVVEEDLNYIVAVHVLEHIPDLIGWLLDVRKVLVVDGAIYTVIPNKTHVFDIGRPITTVGELLEDHEMKRTKPSPGRIFDQSFYHKKVDPRKLHENYSYHKKIPRTFPPERAYEQFEKARDGYQDGHCNVFTPESFKEAIEVTNRLGLQPFTVGGQFVNRDNPNEFITQLVISK